MAKINKAQQKAITKYHKKHKFQGPLTPAQENAAYEEDMRRRSGAPEPDFHKPQKRVKQK